MNTDEKNVLIMNFSGIYEHETFARQTACRWLNCRQISGTDCYCDREALTTLKKMMSSYPVHGIHFIDSGNYHYITKLWTDRIRHPFSLIVFDHHPDMQPPAFQGLLSCGDWVKDLVDHNPLVRKVIIIGASDQLIQAVPDSYAGKVVFYSESSLQHEATWKRFSTIHLNEPVYISIDKDVLNTRSARTNWNQGSMSLNELKKLLGVILQKEKIIGIDICGENATTPDVIKEETDAELNNTTNESLLRFFLSSLHRQSA